jgi:hypothetical protein
MIKMGGCGFCIISSIWKSGSRAKSEHSVTLRSDLLCLMYVSTLGQSPAWMVCMGINGCHAL